MGGRLQQIRCNLTVCALPCAHVQRRCNHPDIYLSLEVIPGRTPDQYLLPFYERTSSQADPRRCAGRSTAVSAWMYTAPCPKGWLCGLMVGGRSLDGEQVNNELTRLFLNPSCTRGWLTSVGCASRQDTPEYPALGAQGAGQGCTNRALLATR